MNFGQAVSVGIFKWINFKDRASRSEFWWFNLFILLICFGFGLFGYSVLGYEGYLRFTDLASVITIIPAISVATRRLHDIGKSGWHQLWILTIIGLIPLMYWWCSEGSKTENEYGDFINLDEQSNHSI